MTANKRQVGGDHYRKNGTEIQHWDYSEMKNFDKFQYVITKYIERWKDKNGLVDLEKAQHYLEKYIEVERAKLLLNANRIDAIPKTTQTVGFSSEDKKLRIQLSGQQHPFGYNAAEDI